MTIPRYSSSNGKTEKVIGIEQMLKKVDVVKLDFSEIVWNVGQYLKKLPGIYRWKFVIVVICEQRFILGLKT